MKPSKKKPRRKTKRRSGGSRSAGPRCGLCGKTGNLTKTQCCDNWICDDADQYVLFSYARNSCYRNHDRFTLCGYHHMEGHPGHWKTCPRCREEIETEMYVHFGTNEYNFEKLENPPHYEPTRCAKCNSVIVLSEGGYSVTSEGHFCGNCTDVDLPSFMDPPI